MAGQLDACGLSDKGHVAEFNEDQFLIADLKKSVIIHRTSLSYDDETHLMGGSQAKLLLVADGRSDDPAGERASRMAVQSIVQYLLNAMHWLFRMDDGHEDEFLKDLRSALAATQDKIRYTSESDPSIQLGTTMTLAYIVWPQLYLIHNGGGAAFVRRNGKIIRLTRHQMAEDTEGATASDLQNTSSPLHHVMSGLVGTGTGAMIPEVSQFKLALNDKLLLCTDGLTSQLSEAHISVLLSANVSAEEGCQHLVQAAADAGGLDNTTVVLACFTDGSCERLKEEAESTETPRETDAPVRAEAMVI